MPVIKFEIKDCSECPAHKPERVYTADSFEMVFDWFCRDKANKKVGQTETFDPNPKIPAWCPRKGDDL